ncbi:acyltransferase family protein [Flavobacterium sp. W21_SRS_FM6]|uniref:acyltransferase family protein n=1 Tax=Flavobacterium sp. W21_SRS_FM6 TaxID=3240268 RepID=UPI003F93577F
MKFREDINALRAIAVVAVVIFHFNHQWLPGGFAGVDVFFVISGFLMTMIIVKGLEKQTFSILGFYAARVRRIVPALAFLSFILLVVGYLTLPPLDYLSLGKHVAASLTFISNMVYWAESGYFDASSIEKWSLHTWSLSVEWQFYLIYPVVLVALKKFLSLKQIKLVLVLGTIAALILSVLVTFKSSSAAYFLLPTRAWQMLAGGLVFLYPLTLNEKAKTTLQILGLASIFISFFIFNEKTPWPGFAALLPIIGACLVLQANKGQSFLVNNRLCHALGKWSYSIYLWHWPIVVAGVYFSLGENWWYIGLPLSVGLGALSYTFIESKQLSDYRLVKLGSVLRPLPAASILAVAGLAVFMTNGIVNRLPEAERPLVAMALAAKDDWYYPKANLTVGSLKIRKIAGESSNNILILGASHAEQLYPYVANLQSPYNVYFLTRSGCFVTPSMKNPKWSCANIQNYQQLLDTHSFDKIVLPFYSFNSYLSPNNEEQAIEIANRIKEFDYFLKHIKTTINHVYLILGEPRGDEFDPVLSARQGLPDHISEDQVRSYYTVHQYALQQLSELDGVNIIDPIHHLCNDGICKTRDGVNGFFYRDGSHMRPWYAIKSLRYLDEVFLE